MTAVFLSLSEGGTGLGIQSAGGPVRHDSAALRRVVRSAMGLRWRIGLAAALFALPVPAWLLLRNGAPLWLAVSLLLANLLAVPALMTSSIWGAVLKLPDRFQTFLRVDAGSAIARLVLVLGLGLARINALAATLMVVLSSALQQWLLMRHIGDLRQGHGAACPELQRQLISQALALWSLAFFIYLQGVTGVWLLGWSAGALVLADYSALIRLAAFFAPVGALFYQIVIPCLTHHLTRETLLPRMVGALSGYLLLSGLIILGGWLAADWVVWLLGRQYQHLTPLVTLTLLVHSLGILSAILWWLNTARGWLSLVWLNPVLTTLVIAFIVMRPHTVLEMMSLNLLILAVPIGIKGLSVLRGLSKMCITPSP